MSTNSRLRSLHYDRLLRSNQMQTTNNQTGTSSSDKKDFQCAVCYTDGEMSGLVIPKSCKHRICLGCYTKIVIMHTKKAQCPECRKPYLPFTDDSEEEPEQVQQAQLPLVQESSLGVIPMGRYTVGYINNIVTNPTMVISDHHLRLIDRFLDMIDEHYRILTM